ncbi:MAG: tripartite tricarboxylate transporter TctB family protein [Hylemonella sp.]|uniref:tripartite tricarboxylate transporter TctB family protein n=1 Tax=Hylemonella sp. TaxID=2066020 RepID=UPI0022C0DF02|nr:tripartite tricarboxylate transporter TctB family protein [Hylemonella sp.]MCZ8252221.1 tripartite tricarboxylate transporter TctB family protein [Hylemonella sp.]
MFVIVGAAFAIGSTNYNIGTGARMGPGYFPLLLGVLLALLGGLIMFQGVVSKSTTGDKIGKVAWKPLGFIIGANVIFGILLAGLPSIGLPAMGLIPAIFGLTIIASLAGEKFKLGEVLIVATILAIISYGAFVKLLNLQFPVWPAFITG